MKKTNTKQAMAEKRIAYNVGIYGRISVEQEKNTTEAVENQVALIQQFITDHNKNPKRTMDLYPYDIYIDRGVSGTTFERKELARLLQDVKQKKVNCILVKDLSRLGREYVETGYLLEKLLPSLGCRLLAITDHFDSMEAEGEKDSLTMQITNLINEMYARDISKRVIAVQKKKAQQGAYTGTMAPYGYEVVVQKGIRTLKIQEQAAQIVQKIFTAYAQGASVRSILLQLYEEEVHKISDYRKYGNVYRKEGEVLHQWSEGTIASILQNKNYLGKDQNENLHPAIVCHRLYEAVQERKKKKKLQESNGRESNVEEAQMGEQERSEEEAKTKEEKGKAGVKEEQGRSKGAAKTKKEKRKAGVKEKQGRSEDAAKTKERKEEGKKPYKNVYCGCCGKSMHTAYYQSRRTQEKHYTYYCRGYYLVDDRKCVKNSIREDWLIKKCTQELEKILQEQNMDEDRQCGDLLPLQLAAEKRMYRERKYREKQAGIRYRQYKEGIITKEEFEIWMEKKREQEKKIELPGKEKTVEKCSWLWIEKFIQKIYVYPEGRITIIYHF